MAPPFPMTPDVEHARTRADDHPVAARHRPVQVHDDAGRPASFSRRAGRVSVQVPQRGRRPARRTSRRSARDRGALHAALHAARARVPAQLALPQERLRRPARAVPARRAVHPRQRASKGRRRDRHHDQGAVAAHHPVRGSGAGDRVGGLQPQRASAAGLRRGPRGASRRRSTQLNAVPDPEFRIADYGTRRRFSRDWQDEVLRTLQATASGRSSSARATSSSRSSTT